MRFKYISKLRSVLFYLICIAQNNAKIYVIFDFILTLVSRFHGTAACYQSNTKQNLGEHFPELSKTFLNPDR